VAAWALNRLAFMTGETRYSEAARATGALFLPQVEQQPSAFGTLLAALAEQLEPPRTVIVTGERDRFAPWREILDAAYLPGTMTLFIGEDPGTLPAPLAKPASHEVRAWICEGATCLAPIASVEELRDRLRLPRISPSTRHEPPRSPA
jgi:uncharacterized protein YyaL (SSP411 family)